MEEILEPEIKEAIDRWTKINRENASQVIEELSQYRECIQAKKSLREVDINYVGRFYYKLAWAYSICRGKESSKSILEEGQQWYKGVKGHSFKNKDAFRAIYRLLFCYYIEKGEESKAEEVLREKVYFEFSQLSCRLLRLLGDERRDFYSFYPARKHHIEDLRTYQISLSDPSTFNDPVDCPFFEWLKQPQSEVSSMQIDVVQKVYSNIRIRCFMKNLPYHSVYNPNLDSNSFIPEYCNTLMWAHYADSHKGYCVKYEVGKKFFDNEDKNRPVLFFSNVFYVESMDLLKSKMMTKAAFFTKNKFWGYEHEIRLIYYDKDKTPETYQKESMPEDMITDIYFGVRCEDCDKRRIIEALKGRTVKYHQMEIDPKDLYRLKAVPLDSDKIKGLYSRLADLQTCWDELMSIKDTEPAE